jgi:DNA-directed RNA polymerase III subunit RPC3
MTLHSILEHLQDEDHLASGLATHNASNASSLREYINILSAADNPTPAGVAGAFLSSGSAGVGGRVQVEFYGIYRQLKLAVLDGYVRERWGQLAVRVVRILLSMGKMDEKQIAKVAMIAPNDVRPLISVLSAASIISLHEVSKGKDFLPRRTSYFW